MSHSGGGLLLQEVAEEFALPAGTGAALEAKMRWFWSDEDRHRQFQAASTTKNFTTAATLDALGRNHRFRTPVTHTGRITRSGTLHGNLVLVASGDLTMGGREKPDGTVDYTGFDHTDSNEVPGPATLTAQNPLRGLNDLARQVKRSGIDHVSKNIVIDDRL